MAASEATSSGLDTTPDETLWIPAADREDGLLDGVVDIHCHAGPCVYAKEYDEVETALMMRAAGYRGVLFKQHLLGANRIHFVRQAVPGIEIFGGIALNHYVGGINPAAVAAALMFGAREVKFPNFHAAHHARVFGSPTYTQLTPTGGDDLQQRVAAMQPISVLDGHGKLVPEAITVLEMVAASGIGVETGHISPAEALALVEAAKQLGITRIWQTHANWRRLFDYSIEDVVQLADAGAFIELTANFAFPSYQGMGGYSEAEDYTAAIVRAVGPGRCVMSSDLGSSGLFNAVEGMRVFMHTMLLHGFTRDEIDVMSKRNPAYLVGLDEHHGEGRT